MMAYSAGIEEDEDDGSINPLDFIEQIADANDWSFERPDNSEMMIHIPSRWCSYNFYFAWREDMTTLHFSCVMDIETPPAKVDAVYGLLAAINERMWLGFFSLWTDERLPTFRYSLIFPEGMIPSLEQIEELTDIALGECDRFYPAFQFVIHDNKSPAEAITAAMIEPMGEA